MQSGNSTQPPVQLSSRIQARIKEAELYLGQGLFEEARQIYRELLDGLGAAPGESVAAFRRSLQQKLAAINEEEAKFLGTPVSPASASEEEAPEGEETSEGESHFERGRRLLAKDQLAEAIEEFLTAADVGYRPAECAFYLARCYQELGRHLDAVNVLQEALDLPDIDNSQRGRLLEQLAVATEAAGDEGATVEPEEPPVSASPPRPVPVPRPVKGTREERLERDERPVVVPLARPEPPPRPARDTREETLRQALNVAKLHVKNRQFLKGIQQLRQLRSQLEVPATNLIGIYEEILEQDPENLEALKDLAEILTAEDALTQAATYLERIQEISPRDSWSQTQLTDLYRQLLETEEASVDIRLKLARNLLRAARIEDALDQYVEILLEDTPYRLPTLIELGEVLLGQRQYDRIVELLGDALEWVQAGKEGPEVLRYYAILGKAYEEKKLPDQARECYRRAHAIDPHDQAIRDKVTVHETGPLVSRVIGSPSAEARQYSIEAKLGEDEALELFRVKELPPGVIRVAKTLLPQIAGRDRVKEFIRRWSYEQVTMENRNLARILDVAESKGRYYFITEDFDTTLTDLLADKGSLPVSAAVRLARALLNALAYAHSHRGTDDTLRKIFHLSLNPRRVYIKDDLTKARVADLGLTFLLDTVLNWNPDYTERSPGELAYMAPEQFDRSPAKMPDKMKQAVDIYTFGVVFYQALTGHLPFTGPSPEDFCKQHNEKYPVPPRVFISTIPAKLDELVLKCLQKDPKKRWRTPTEIDLALEKINLGE
jgi:serine/threonine protein kinase/thioredoxin-like negative regulator of GroEL